MKGKTVVVFSLLMVVLVGLIGCTSGAGSKTETAVTADGGKASKDKIKLVVTSFMSQEERIKMMDETIKIFNQKRPDVTVEYTAVGSDYDKNLKLAYSSGEGQDIVYVDDKYQQMLQNNNYLMDLTPYAQEHKWLEKQIPGAMEFNNLRTPDKIYSVPFLMAPVTVYYNKDIFKKLNVNPPADLQEFEAILEKAKAAGYTPMANAGVQNYQLLWSLYSLIYGQIPMDDVNKFYYQKGTTENFAKTFQSSLQMLQGWVEKRYFTENMSSVSADALLPVYAKGQTAMMVDGDWDLPAIEKLGFNMGTFAFPQADKSLAHSIVNASDGAWALNAKLSEEKKKAALDFIDTFMKPEVVKIWAEGGLTSTIKDTGSDLKLSPLRKELNEAVAKTKMGFYLDNAVPGILDVMTKETQRMMLKEITPEQCWKNIKTEYDKLVQQAKAN